jgi:hypothetical protein
MQRIRPHTKSTLRRRVPGIAINKTPASIPAPYNPIPMPAPLPADFASPIGCGAVVVIVSIAVVIGLLSVALVIGQVASFIAAGSAHVTLTGPKKLSVPTSVTVAVPGIPGALIVTFGIGDAILNVVSTTVIVTGAGLCDAM